MIALVYYLSAARGLLPGASLFFSEPGQQPFWLVGVTIWLVPSLVMAVVWGLCWTKNRRWIGACVACFALAVPPLGIIGWANPLATAGALYPGLGWLGMAMAVVALAVAAVPAQKGRILVGLSLTVGLVANLSFSAAPPLAVVPVDTQIGRGVAGGDDYGQMRRLQADVIMASARLPAGTVMILPELLGGDWSLNEIWWDDVHRQLFERGQTALIGARRTIPGSGTYENGLYTIGALSGKAYIDRVPVPIGMWRPWADVSAKAVPFSSGTIRLGNLNAGVLICYEQLLVFPALRTFWDRPAVLVGASNSWWAASTSIPAIQRQSVAVWGRLFNVPITYAENR